MLGCLWHDIAVSLISFQYQLMWVHKCNLDVKFIQSLFVSLSLFLFPAQPFPMSQSGCSHCV